MNRCLEDKYLIDEELDENTKEEIIKSNTKIIIDDLNELGKLNNIEQQPIIRKQQSTNVNILSTSVSKPSTPTVPTTSTGISNKKFYSNAFNFKSEKENSSKAANKRRHSQSYHDENFPESNDENSCTTTNRQIAQISPITPKRNCLSLYGSTPPSSGSFQKWNRNNSMGKSSGGKGLVKNQLNLN